MHLPCLCCCERGKSPPSTVHLSSYSSFIIFFLAFFSIFLSISLVNAAISPSSQNVLCLQYPDSLNRLENAWRVADDIKLSKQEC